MNKNHYSIYFAIGAIMAALIIALFVSLYINIKLATAPTYPLPSTVFTPPLGAPSDIEVQLPQGNSQISNPVKIQGRARGPWYFEAQFTASVLDAGRNNLGTGILTATSDWMTNEFVPFTGEIKFSLPKTETGYIQFKNANPSGLPEHEKTFEFPVKFNPQSTSVKVYFSNNNLDPEITCEKVFPVERVILKTDAIARTAIEELLKGVLVSEKNEGFYSNLNEGVRLQSIKIENGTAYVDFNDKIDSAVGGSCRVGAIRAQISETLKQFPSVKEVVISRNGNAEEVLQP